MSGFWGRDEARDFIAQGNVELGGKQPVNTHGGLIGEACIHRFNHINEALRQPRGTAISQVADAQHILVSAGMSKLIFGKW